MTVWSTLTLEDVTRDGSEGLRRGPFGGAIRKDSFVSAGYKIYEQRHAIYGDFDVGSYYIGERHYKELKSFAVMPGDLIVSCSGTLGRVAIVPPAAKPGIINQALLRIRPRPNLVSPQFFKMLLETPELQSRLFGGAGGSAIKNVKPLSEIRKVQFQLPPLSEQQRITRILDQAEALRAKRRDALAQLDKLTQSIFFDLFGDPSTNPRGWDVTPFGEEIGSVRYGTGSPPEYVEDGIPFIRATNVKRGTISSKDLMKISATDADRLAKCKVSFGNLIVVRSGVNTGDCAIVPQLYDGACAAFDLIVDLSHANAIFYNHLINSPYGRRYLAPLTRRAAQSHLNADQLRSLNFISPRREKKEEFARCIAGVEKLRAGCRATLTYLDSLFAALRHRAFRGEL